jgi:hypothetical protein
MVHALPVIGETTVNRAGFPIAPSEEDEAMGTTSNWLAEVRAHGVEV